jgi:hypothetical protein
MHQERRQFLFTVLAVAASGVARAQESEFSLNFKSETFDPKDHLVLAVVATAPCLLECTLSAGEGQRKLGVGKWYMEPREARTLTNEGIAGIADISLTAEVLPKGAGRPHIGGLIRVGGQSDLDHLKSTAAKVPFQKDPAPRHQPGQFTVELASNSHVHLKIWRGENEKGAVVHEKLFQNLPSGPNPIPWDLRNNGGKVVEAGEYLATLEATPVQFGKSDTLFFASFQVI